MQPERALSAFNATPVPAPIDPRRKYASGIRERIRDTVPVKDRGKMKELIAEELQVDREAVAMDPGEVTEHTRVYVGQLYPGLFAHAGTLEHIYTKYPTGKIGRFDLIAGGKTPRQLLVAMNNAGMDVADYVREMMIDETFETEGGLEQMDLVRVTVSDLGLNEPSTTAEIYARAEELGLQLCPPEAAARLRLAYKNQSKHEWLRMGMKELVHGEGMPIVFTVEHGNYLGMNWASPDHRWSLETTFVFRQPN